MRARHDKGGLWTGVDVMSGKIDDMAALGVFEPLAVKLQVVKSSSEAASMILRIDDVIASSKAKEAKGPKGIDEGAEGE